MLMEYSISTVLPYGRNGPYGISHDFIVGTLRSLINDQGRLFIFEKNSTLVALIAAWSLIFFKVLTLLVRN